MLLSLNIRFFGSLVNQMLISLKSRGFRPNFLMLLSVNFTFFGFLLDQILHYQISTWPQEGIVGTSIEYIPPLLDQTFGI